MESRKIMDGSSAYYCSYGRAVGFDSSLRQQYVDKTSVHTSNPDRLSTLHATLADGQSFNNERVAVPADSPPALKSVRVRR